MDIVGIWEEEYWVYDFNIDFTYIKTHIEDGTEITTGTWSFNESTDIYYLTVDGHDDIEEIQLEDDTLLNSTGHYLIAQ